MEFNQSFDIGLFHLNFAFKFFYFVISQSFQVIYTFYFSLYLIYIVLYLSLHIFYTLLICIYLFFSLLFIFCFKSPTLEVWQFGGDKI